MENPEQTTPSAPSMEQALLAFMQQMAQSNIVNQRTLQGLQSILQHNTTSQPQDKKKEKLPQLSEFDGTRSKYDGWEIEAQNKIKTDGEAIGTEMDQLRYVFARLRGSARNMCLAFVRAKEAEEDGSGTQLLKYLAATYSDPNRQKKALSSLYSIKQRDDEPFSRFLPRFETELANAGALSFDNSIKISLLENAVNRGMQERLVSVFPVPNEYGSYTSLLQTIGSRVDAFKEPYRQRAQRSSENSKDREKMDWEPTKPLRTNRSTMETTGRRAKWVSQETIAYRMEKRLCLRCGNQGHIVRDCKFLPAQRPLSTARASTSNNARVDPLLAMPEEEEVQREDGIEEELGKV